MSYVHNSHAAGVWAAHRARLRAARGQAAAKSRQRPAEATDVQRDAGTPGRVERLPYPQRSETDGESAAA